MTVKYLIDVNLPYFFSHWKSDEYVHQRDIDACMSDTEIWNYAKTNRLTIVTKDTDFSDRLINQSPPPRVIHFKIGNMKLQSFHDFIEKNWDTITELSSKFKLISVYSDRIEGID